MCCTSRSRSRLLALALLGVGALGGGGVRPAVAQEAAADEPEVSLSPAERREALYALGAMLAEDLAIFDMDASQRRWLLKGIDDALRGRKLKVPLAEHEDLINKLADVRHREIVAREEELSAAHLEHAAAQPGAEVLPSGLVFRPLSEGLGEHPTQGATVRVHYEGTLQDGTVFDSSRERGEPAEFALDRVIPCWSEGLLLMAVGQRARITCPAALAYGDQGASDVIPPHASISFDVELLAIVPEEAPQIR